MRSASANLKKRKVVINKTLGAVSAAFELAQQDVASSPGELSWAPGHRAPGQLEAAVFSLLTASLDCLLSVVSLDCCTYRLLACSEYQLGRLGVIFLCLFVTFLE